MKRKRLLQLFERHGWYLYRHGGNHDIWTNGKEKEIIPRHPNINEWLARDLIRKHQLR
ncbi:type II toxin-antitoxin system HicA family toxin [Lentilactobacillus buchneri]|uniref:type II toxin-antitoxin system HicA family toxin n=1 Tax=Lentilactobacillus buchneri TaxID=1581 RepID=UPI0021A58B15|nr:type II toxin-antitoxin system HicA family toxin [Lentilactobacillus buchneri]MCT2881361.1 type II toxin-antitoxin system HicA family toxin [Lentilactobacillus buchneri]